MYLFLSSPGFVCFFSFCSLLLFVSSAAAAKEAADAAAADAAAKQASSAPRFLKPPNLIYLNAAMLIK